MASWPQNGGNCIMSTAQMPRRGSIQNQVFRLPAHARLPAEPPPWQAFASIENPKLAQLRKMPGHGFVEPELPLLDELHGCHGRQGLGHGGDALPFRGILTNLAWCPMEHMPHWAGRGPTLRFGMAGVRRPLVKAIAFQ